MYTLISLGYIFEGSFPNLKARSFFSITTGWHFSTCVDILDESASSFG